MVLTLSIVQSCGLCYYGKGLRSAIVFEAERGYRNALGRKMRFNKFVLSKISKLCSRQKHELAGHLLAELARIRISDRSKYLEKVSSMMDYDSLHDSIDNGSAKKQTGMNHKDAMDEVDVSLACKRFPSIILGRSPKVELYNEATHCSEMSKPLAAQNCEGFVPNLVDAEWVQEGSSETWRLLSGSLIVTTSSKGEKDSYKPLSPPNHPILTTSSKGEKDSHKPLSPRPMALETVEKSDDLVSGEESSNKVGPESPVNAASIESFLNSSIDCIPGLSKRHCRQLDNCGFHTLRKLLHHFPRTYADLQNAQTGIDDGQYLIFIGKILSSRGIRASFSFSFLEVVVGCEIAENQSNPEHTTDDVGSKEKKTIYLHLKKFFRGSRFTFQPFLKSLEAKHKEGEIVCVSGKVRSMRFEGHFEMREYNIDVIQEEQDSSFRAKGRPYPIYPSKGGINPIFLRDTIARALQALPVNIDPIPKDITQDFKLLTLHDAYIGIHQPKNINEADLARKRLIFDEFFYLQLGRLYQMLEGLGTKIEKDGLLDRYRKPELNAVYMEEWSSLTKNFLKALPYSVTSSQLNAVSEIILDLKRPIPMNRLLQGDVGCGKTVVAFLACMEVIGSGYQGAFMVPSKLLAIQHYEHLLNLLENMEEVECKPSVALLTGSTPSKQSRMIREGLQAGNISLVIGTHSLIAEKVEFSALRIAVVDEQHRFGVIQRGRFNSKITDLPPGRIPVETFIIEGNDDGFENVYKMMLDELEVEGKVYLVYPVIEPSEQLPQLRAASADLEVISHRFEGYSCGLLHGKMKSDEKEEALRRFRSGETRILLSTQVIEIGVDVPDASMMVVMNAERFGIAQLHQLRGRVGRRERKSKCILLASTTTGLNRLKVLRKSSDGFYLANVDLLLRGPGDLLGKKQSGHLPEFPIARLEIDGNILQDAHLAALSGDSSHMRLLEDEVNQLLDKEAKMWRQWSKIAWLRDGDRNTQFFHSKAFQRRWRNYITKLHDANGGWCSSQDQVNATIVDFYQNLFTSGSPSNFEEVIETIPHVVTDEMNDMLMAEFHIEEVEVALKQMEPLKAPGLDGMPLLFYQSYWSLLGSDVSTTILHYLNSGTFPQALGHSFITLIPKVKDPTYVSEFRPISLSNVLYRIFAKVLTNRLQAIMPNLILEHQSAFLSDRLISDNILVAFETLHYMRNHNKGKSGFMALKLDMSKAYDRVEWEYMERVMLKMDFHARWIQLMMMCITTASYLMLINGEPHRHITPTLGLRQGDPLSPYFFLMCTEGLHGLIKLEKRNVKACLKCWQSMREFLGSKSTVLRPLFSSVNPPMQTLK